VTFTDPQWLDEERRCLAALRRGDRAAFQRLYQVMAPPLYGRILLPRLGDPVAAEEALADTFARAVERLDGYQDRGGSIWSWLVTIAIHRALDLHRERARVGRALAGFHALVTPLLGEADAPNDEALDHEKLRAAVAAALARLNPRYRRALELRFFEERERDDCAACLEVKVGTFDVLLLRALRAFRAAWLDSTSPELGAAVSATATATGTATSDETGA
jgi:RNA polymerase sigma factor (sigma-70 family)